MYLEFRMLAPESLRVRPTLSQDAGPDPALSLEAWKLRYEDTQEIWRGCGAVWLDEKIGGDDMVDEGHENGDDGEEEEVGGGSGKNQYLKRNLRPALNVMETCLRNG